jgi:quercetin dioxygenase-like cupin family protein
MSNQYLVILKSAVENDSKENEVSEKGLQHPRVSPEEMEKRVFRFKDIEGKGTPVGVPLMFIDSILPGHYRMNYAVIGDTASEDPAYQPILDQPHKFQIGMCPPGNGPAWHTHDYIEMFMPLSGEFRFYYGNDPDGEPEGEALIGPWDMISLPPGLWRSFENAGEENAWCFAVLEQHEVYAGKDPYWPDWLVEQAREHGLEVDDKGKMVKPPNFEELRAEVEAKLLHRK